MTSPNEDWCPHQCRAFISAVPSHTTAQLKQQKKPEREKRKRKKNNKNIKTFLINPIGLIDECSYGMSASLPGSFGISFVWAVGERTRCEAATNPDAWSYHSIVHPAHHVFEVGFEFRCLGWQSLAATVSAVPLVWWSFGFGPEFLLLVHWSFGHFALHSRQVRWSSH